ncbi:hypothetical protein D3C71_1283620 [compost metagenome]
MRHALVDIGDRRGDDHAGVAGLHDVPHHEEAGFLVHEVVGRVVARVLRYPAVQQHAVACAVLVVVGREQTQRQVGTHERRNHSIRIYQQGVAFLFHHRVAAVRHAGQAHIGVDTDAIGAFQRCRPEDQVLHQRITRRTQHAPVFQIQRGNRYLRLRGDLLQLDDVGGAAGRLTVGGHVALHFRQHRQRAAHAAIQPLADFIQRLVLLADGLHAGLMQGIDHRQAGKQRAGKQEECGDSVAMFHRVPPGHWQEGGADTRPGSAQKRYAILFR